MYFNLIVPLINSMSKTVVCVFQCGFFRRRRPEEQAFLVPAPHSPTNGEYKTVSQNPPDARYKYT